MGKNWKKRTDAILNSLLKMSLEVIGFVLIAQALGILDKQRFVIGGFVLALGLEHKPLTLLSTA